MVIFQNQEIQSVEHSNLIYDLKIVQKMKEGNVK